MKKNVIPRKFNRIICKMLVPTSESKIGIFLLAVNCLQKKKWKNMVDVGQTETE